MEFKPSQKYKGVNWLSKYGGTMGYQRIILWISRYITWDCDKSNMSLWVFPTSPDIIDSWQMGYDRMGYFFCDRFCRNLTGTSLEWCFTGQLSPNGRTHSNSPNVCLRGMGGMEDGWPIICAVPRCGPNRGFVIHGGYPQITHFNRIYPLVIEHCNITIENHHL